MTKPTVRQIQNAFVPAKEIDDAKRFAGRRDAVVASYEALVSDGAHIAIIGNRGIGKTSLARQVANLAQGNGELLERLEIRADEQLDFLTVYLAAGESTQNTTHLLERLLTNNDCLYEWVYEVPRARKKLEAYKPKFSAWIAELGGEKATTTETEPAVAGHDIETVFTNVCNDIVRAGIAKDGILVIVDEFDQIPDVAGFASFLKALATNAPKVKFCIVGVSHDIRELVKQHESANRLFAGAVVPLPPMRFTELAEIIEFAETSIDNSIRFGPEATQSLCRLADGHPYMVHLVGKYALSHAYATGETCITEPDVRDALHGIAQKGSDPVLEGRYKKAVVASRQREAVLRALAFTRPSSDQDDDEILTTDAYKLALDAGVDNASQYVGQLVIDEFGAELVKVRERYYRFRDSLFATYVMVRPPIFPDNANIGPAQV